MKNRLELQWLLLVQQLLVTSGYGAVIYVNDRASGRGTGDTWQDAYNDLQLALARAESNDQVWIAKGVYKPTSRDGRRDACFALPSGVAMYGGFRGSESSLESRDWTRNATVLSGEIGDRRTRMDNNYRVITVIDAQSGTLLDGLYVQGAYNDCGCPNSRGGGLYVENSELAVRNCVVRWNQAGGGGGMWNQDSITLVEGSRFEENTNRAISNNASTVRLVYCSFVRNMQENNGEGAAIGDFSGTTTVASNCQFQGNVSRVRAGAVYSHGSDSTYIGCVFERNRTGDAGGAIFQFSGSLVLRECAFINNTAEGATAGGVGSLPEPVISNCIFWGNRGGGGTVEQWQLDGRTFDVTNTCIEGWTGNYGGVGNHGLDPQFVDFDGGDYRLTAGSPCIDAGDNEAVTEPYDLDGNPRILNDVVDMGAYESVCDEVTKLKTSCKGEPGAGKLVAKLHTSLPGGSTVMVRCDDGRSTPAAIKPNGRGKAKWSNQTGPVEVCPSGCPDSCRTADCP